MTAYATAGQLRDHLRDTLVNLPGQYDLALDAATALIDSYCGRSFSVPATTSTKILRADSPTLLWIPDLASVSGLVVSTDDDGDGVFEATWAASDVQAEPLDRMGGTRPIELLRAVGSRRFPHDCSPRGRYDIWATQRRARVQVVGRWGWSSTPNEVIESCLLLSGDLLRGADAGSKVFQPGQPPFFSGARAAVGLGNVIVEALLAPLRATVVA